MSSYPHLPHVHANVRAASIIHPPTGTRASVGTCARTFWCSRACVLVCACRRQGDLRFVGFVNHQAERFSNEHGQGTEVRLDEVVSAQSTRESVHVGEYLHGCGSRRGGTKIDRQSEGGQTEMS